MRKLSYQWESAYNAGVTTSTEFVKLYGLKMRSYAFNEAEKVVSLIVDDFEGELPEWVIQN